MKAFLLLFLVSGTGVIAYFLWQTEPTYNGMRLSRLLLGF